MNRQSSKFNQRLDSGKKSNNSAGGPKDNHYVNLADSGDNIVDFDLS